MNSTSSNAIKNNSELKYNNIVFLLFLVMDPETAAGETAEHCAESILVAMLKGDNDITSFQYLIVKWIRVTFPSLFYFIMERRAKKLAPRYRNPQYL